MTKEEISQKLSDTLKGFSKSDLQKAQTLISELLNRFIDKTELDQAIIVYCFMMSARYNADGNEMQRIYYDCIKKKFSHPAIQKIVRKLREHGFENCLKASLRYHMDNYFRSKKGIAYVNYQCWFGHFDQYLDIHRGDEIPWETLRQLFYAREYFENLQVPHDNVN